MSSPTHRLLAIAVLTLSSGIYSNSTAFSQTRTWVAPNAGNLLNGANWSGGVAPNGVGQKAVISTSPLPNQTAFWLPGDSTITLGAFEHSNTRASGLSAPTSRLVMAASSGNALFQVSQGSFGTDLAEIHLQSSTVFDMSGLGGDFNNEHPLGGAFTGSGALIKTGPDRIRLFEDNSYTGGTDIQGGTVRGFSIADQGVNSSFGRGNFSLSGGGTLMLSDFDGVTNRTISLGAGGGGIYLDRSLTLNGAISGIGGLELQRGTLTLNAANTYGGSTDIQGGTLKLGISHVIPNTSAVRMVPGATFDLNGNSEQIGSLSGGGRVLLGATGSLAVGLDATSTTFSGVISGGGGLNKSQAGTLTLTNVNTYSGNTIIAAGTIHLDGAGSIAQSNLVRVRTGASLLRTGGDLANSNSLEINANGNLLLDSNALQNSGNVISYGRIQGNVANFGSGNLLNNGLIQGDVATFGGGTLLGRGTIDGNLTVGSGGTLSPGSSPDNLDVLGNASWDEGGAYIFEINDVLGVAGTNWDLLAIGGTLDLTATPANSFAIDVHSLTLFHAAGEAANFDPLQSYAWTLATAAGGISGFNPLAFVIDSSNFTNPHEGRFAVAQFGNSLQLVYSVPEPNSLVLAFIAAVGCWVVQRGRAARGR